MKRNTKSDTPRANVMIEYSQPNTHKSFHVGHMRNVVLGDSLGRIYKACGYPVTMVNYIGDEGAHIAKCLWYILKNGHKAPAEHRGEWLGQMYAAATMALDDATVEEKPVFNAEVSQVLRDIESKKGDTYELWKSTREWSLDDFKEIYEWSGAHFDHWFYESEVSEESQEIVDEYLKKDVFVESDRSASSKPRKRSTSLPPNKISISNKCSVPWIRWASRRRRTATTCRTAWSCSLMERCRLVKGTSSPLANCVSA
ncbi:MAG: arginine--tRNA ligase [Proteobacteria bacterium]|nr:MAG: arginine--tRNA ligase [Pseudomonadota bacterium]